jgi:hypothetical protein
MKLEPLLQMPNVTMGVWRRFGVHAFEGNITAADMDRMASAGEAWMRKNPGTFVEMVIIFPSNARMSGDERAKLAGIIKKAESRRAASATVVLASGLTGAMHRSVLTGLQMLAPPPHPTKVFGAVDEAVFWLSAHVRAVCGPDATPQAIQDAVEQMCAAFRPRALRGGTA